MTEELTSWDEYLRAKIEIYLEGAWRCIFDGRERCELFEPLARLFESHAESYIVTAWNPGELRLSYEENLQRNHELESMLRAVSGVQLFPAKGSSQDESYLEMGYLVVSETPMFGLKEMTSIARLFDQEAIYVIKKGMLYCLSVGGDRKIEMAEIHRSYS